MGRLETGFSAVKDEISPDMVRAARALLGISQQDLATEAGVSRSAIADLERGAKIPQASTVRTIVSILELKGIQFVVEDDEVIGVAKRPT